MKSNIGVARVVEMPKPVQRSGAQLTGSAADASGRRIRPAALRMEQKAGMVLRQLLESGGDIVRIARRHGVGCNDVGRVVVAQLQQRKSAA